MEPIRSCQRNTSRSNSSYNFNFVHPRRLTISSHIITAMAGSHHPRTHRESATLPYNRQNEVLLNKGQLQPLPTVSPRGEMYGFLKENTTANMSAGWRKPPETPGNPRKPLGNPFHFPPETPDRHVRVWVPGGQQAPDRSTDRPTKPTDRPAHRPTDPPTGRRTGRPSDRRTDRPTDGRPIDAPTDRPID